MTTEQEELMRAFDFTEDDLSVNQRGLISEHQRARLRGLARGNKSCSVQSGLIALGFAFLGLCLILVMFLQNESSRQVLFSNPLNVVLLGSSLLLALAIFAGVVWWERKRADELTNAPLRKVEGIATVKKEYTKYGSGYYTIKIGEWQRNLLPEYARGFRDGATYRVYYCKSGYLDTVLSIEVL